MQGGQGGEDDDANSNLVVWMRNSWLRTFNMLLPGSNYKLRELLERAFVEDIE